MTDRSLADATGLFLTFAAVPLTEGGLIEFADRFGILGGIGLYEIDPWDDDSETRGVMQKYPGLDWMGEPVTGWLSEIRAMAEAVELWNLAKQEDRNVLAKHIGADPCEDLVRLATFRIVQTINLRLQSSATLMLSIDDSTSAGISFETVPTSLLSALWLQFAIAVKEGKNYRRCEKCRRWFEVASPGARSDKRYCSNACRSWAFRGRKELARKLRDDGMELEMIAKFTGSDPGTVGRWLKKVEPR